MKAAIKILLDSAKDFRDESDYYFEIYLNCNSDKFRLDYIGYPKYKALEWAYYNKKKSLEILNSIKQIRKHFN